MVRIVRTPSVFREYCSGNDLSGHMDGIKYTAKELKRRCKYRVQNNLKLPVEEPVQPVTFGKKASK